jgi:hypothetical protein
MPMPGFPFGNVDPSLAHAWQPVALARELRPGGWLQVRLLDRTWTLHRTTEGVTAEPAVSGVWERHGVVWLAPSEPVDAPLDAPELVDRRFVSGWLPPVRSAGPAAPLVDALLGMVVADGPGDVVEEPGGFRATVLLEGLPGRMVMCTYRAPFQLLVREVHPESGAITTALFLLQPEDVDSTRIYTRLLLSDGPGRPLPAPSDVVERMAGLHRMLESLRPRAAGDRLGVALRRALGAFTESSRTENAA